MGIFHFLNVRNGDCAVIQHPSGHVSVIDVNNAGTAEASEARARKSFGVTGSFNQEESPVDPIVYLEERDISEVFRFILTHPDMDHMGGMKAFFEKFNPFNFWDTDNTVEKNFEEDAGPYNEEDWTFYKNLRDTNPQSGPKRLVLYSGSKGQYFNVGEGGKGGGDGLYVLAPTPDICAGAKESGECNDYSYVLLYRSTGGRILLSGDSHDVTWEHILKNHEADVRDVDVLLAPHHGRHSDRDFSFLDVVKPRLTLFGNADLDDLAHEEWSKRGLAVISNDQAGCVLLDTNSADIGVFATHQAFAEQAAEQSGNETYYNSDLRAYYCFHLSQIAAPATTG